MMYALVLWACLASGGSCKAVVHAEPLMGLMGCIVAGMPVSADFEKKNPGWRVKSTYCTPQQRVQELLAKLNGMDA